MLHLATKQTLRAPKQMDSKMPPESSCAGTNLGTRPPLGQHGTSSYHYLWRRSSHQSRTKPIRSANQLVSNTGFEGGMTRIRHDAQIRFRPSLVQVPSGARRTHYVIASLHDDAR